MGRIAFRKLRAARGEVSKEILSDLTRLLERDEMGAADKAVNLAR